MKEKTKKGIQLNQAFGAVLTLVLIAVLVIISIFLFVTLGSGFLTQDYSQTVINESGAYLNTSNAGGYNLSANTKTGFASPVITQIVNTSGSIITAPNYTVTSTGTLQNLTAITALHVTNLRVSYTYTWDANTASSNATDVMITNFATFPALIGLLGTVIFLGLVIGVLIASFAFGGKQGA